MSYEAKDGSGALFKNDKGDNPARPDYRGDITIEGTTYELSAWIKATKNDPAKKFMSLSAKPKDGQRQASRAPQRQQRETSPVADDDSIPF